MTLKEILMKGKETSHELIKVDVLDTAGIRKGKYSKNLELITAVIKGSEIVGVRNAIAGGIELILRHPKGTLVLRHRLDRNGRIETVIDAVE